MYYDALPEKRDNQTSEQFEAEYAVKEKLLDTIARARNFSVRPALTSRGRKREQKSVDVLLAIECFLHCIRNNIDEESIIKSDLDFYPLFEAMITTRTRSILRYDKTKTSDYLIRAADIAKPLTDFDVGTWIDQKYGNLIGGSNYTVNVMPDSYKLDSVGSISGRMLEIFYNPNDGTFMSRFKDTCDARTRNSGFFLVAWLENDLNDKIIWSYHSRSSVVKLGLTGD